MRLECFANDDVKARLHKDATLGINMFAPLLQHTTVIGYAATFAVCCEITTL